MSFRLRLGRPTISKKKTAVLEEIPGPCVVPSESLVVCGECRITKGQRFGRLTRG